jgi:hemoglobin
MTESSRSLPSARTFYDEVGGASTFVRLVSHFYAGVRTDPVLVPLYPPDDWEDAWLTHMRAAVDSLGLSAEQDATLWRYLASAADSMQNRFPDDADGDLSSAR